MSAAISRRDLETLIDRVAEWPAAAQSALLRAALDIDLDQEPPIVLDDDDKAALARSRQDVDDGAFASAADIRRLFKRGA